MGHRTKTLRPLRIAAYLLGGCLAAPAAFADDVAQDVEIDPARIDAVQAERRGFEALNGPRGATDPAAASRWLERAAAENRPNAQIALARLYWDGRGVQKDTKRALELVRAAADHGIASAQSFLGWAYLTGSEVEQDFGQALRWLTAAARQEDGYALLLLAQMYNRGEGVDRNEPLAVRLLERSAELGHPPACLAAAGLYLHGEAAHKDVRRGMHVLRKAADADQPGAAYALGREYLFATRVRRDGALASQWLTRALQSQHRLAAMWLSEMHAKGLGVAKDAQRAGTLLEEALAAATASEKNEFAWELSVLPDAQLRNGALAIKVLQPAVAAAEHPSPAHIDTLAAAYAEAGQFDQAIETQLAAIAAASSAKLSDAEQDRFRQRLDLYQRKQPYREAPQ